MGLNMNYSLLIRGNNSTSSIPEYRRYYAPEFISESTFASYLSEFNQEIRESRQFLSTLYEVESINEATASVNIVNGIMNVANRVRTAVIKLAGIIIEGIRKAIEAIEKFAASVRTKVDAKLKTHERMSILRKVLAEESVTITISDIEPTRDLLDKSFPDTSIIGSDLVKMATDTMNNYCTNIIQKDGADASLLDDTEVKASDSFVKFIESSKNKMLSQIFGRYTYDETAITKSAHDVADKAFGVSDKSDVKVTENLYLLACDNLEKNSLNSIVKDMKSTMKEVQKNYNAVAVEMNTIADSVKYLDKMSSNNYSVDMKERYYKATKTIIDRVNRTLNVIQQVVNADFVLATRKASRTYEIFGISGDSAKVKNKCDMLIMKRLSSKAGYDVDDAKYKDLQYSIGESSITSRKEVIDTVNEALISNGLKSHIFNGERNQFINNKSNSLCIGSFDRYSYRKAYGIVEGALPEGYNCYSDDYLTISINAPEMVKENYDVYNGREEVEEFFQIQDDFNTAAVMAEEAFLEDAFTETVMMAILEAEGDQNQTASSNNTSTTTPQATETTVSQATEVKKPNGSSVIEFVQKIIASMGQAMQRFRNRIDELIIKNPLNQQYWQKNKGNIQKLELTDTKVNEWYNYNIDYFANSTFIKFDQNNLDNPDLKTDEALQNAIIKKITNNGNIPNFEEKDSFAQKVNKIYQGEFIKVENGDGKTLQEVRYDHDKAFNFVDEIMTRGFGGEILGKVANDYKEIDTDYKAVKSNYESLAARMKSSTNTAEQKAAEVENKKTEPQNAAAMMVEEDFKFNLAEYFGLVHNEASFAVGQNDAQSANANGASDSQSGKNKELDAMIKRCFQYNTIAVTAKMTAALGAYKQYMGLFKAVYKPAKNNNKQQQNQNNNNTEAKPTEEKK